MSKLPHNNIQKSSLMILSNHENSIEAIVLYTIHSYLTKKGIKIQLTTKLGGEIKISNYDKGSEQVSNHYLNSLSSLTSISLDNVDPEKYDGLIIPSCKGIYEELKSEDRLGYILSEFNKSEKIICAIGFGVGGLLSAKFPSRDVTSRGEFEWMFKSRSITGVTMKEMCKIMCEKGLVPIVQEHGLFLETNVHFEGGNFVSTDNFSQPHIVIDSNLITGQNEASYDLILKIFVSQMKS